MTKSGTIEYGKIGRPKWQWLPVSGSNMRRLNGHVFYELGTKLERLSRISAESTYVEVWWELFQARVGVQELIVGMPALEICIGPANELIEAITRFVPVAFQEAVKLVGTDKDKGLEWRHHSITKAKEAFETVLAAELAALDTYHLDQQGIYKTSDLVDRADLAFTEKSRKSIPDDAKKDFRESGRCLAFELPTASGFHATRAVEATLREYHKLRIPPTTTPTKPPDMATCITQLKAAGEDPKLIDILDHVRDLHRNTIMHPQAFLTIEDALGLFDIAKSAISSMAGRIAALTPAASAPGASAIGATTLAAIAGAVPPITAPSTVIP